tara:strand:- start:1009 stop:1926 length:918 start_codon:yes stop_codon:yes gene_type:complete
MQRILIPFFTILFLSSLSAQEQKPFELNETWLSKITANAPSADINKEGDTKTILIFSLHTGFKHWTIPHTEAVVKILAEQSGGFKVFLSKDISVFEKENLAQYDAVVLNNNCSIGDKRNLFWDVLKEDASLTDTQRLEKAGILENNLLQYVDAGGGLMLLHGAIVMQNKSEAFGKMVGGSFDYHPKQQEIKVKLVDAAHPLVQAFKGKGFTHIDEPYMFNNAYFDYNFRPLLYMEANQIVGKKAEVEDNIKYISWIKRYGSGRIFYASPSHNAQSYENPDLLAFLFDGMRYVVGDLTCDDSPMKQ